MTISFVDYAWWQVTPAQLKSMGFSGAMRYFTPHNTKSATKPEVDNLIAASLDVGGVFESTANRSTQGFNAGHDDAVGANAFADSLGYPAASTLWYAVDFDASPGQVQAYFDGIGSLAGGRKYAPYGSAAVIEGVRYPGIGWQTAAWSGGRVSSRAGLLQNGFHNDYDSNRVLIADFGQWKSGTSSSQPTPQQPPASLQEEPVGAYPLPILAPGDDPYTFRPPPADHSGGIPFGIVVVSFAADFGDTHIVGHGRPVPLRVAKWDVAGARWVVQFGGGSYVNGTFVEENPDLPPLYVPSDGGVAALRIEGNFSKVTLTHCGSAGRVVPLVEYQAG